MIGNFVDVCCLWDENGEFLEMNYQCLLDVAPVLRQISFREQVEEYKADWEEFSKEMTREFTIWRQTQGGRDLKISPELLATNLEGVLEPEYLEPLKVRFEKVREGIRRAKEEADAAGEDFFREKGGWGAESEELLCGLGNYQNRGNYLRRVSGES